MDPTKNLQYLKVLEKYRISNDTRKFEIDLFWRRSIFFWGFIAAAFIAYAQFGSEKISSPYLKLVISAFGLICSFCWTLLNRGSKYWQENWEQHISEIENDVTGRLFNDRRPVKGFFLNPLRARQFSPGKLIIALSDYVVLIWLGLLTYNLTKLNNSGIFISNLFGIKFTREIVINWFCYGTLFYMIYILLFTFSLKNPKILNFFRKKIPFLKNRNI